MRQPFVTHPKGIILYDFYLVKGGAEKVSLYLAKELENTDLCFGSIGRDPDLSSDLEGPAPINLGAGSGNAPLRALKTMHAFSTKTDFLAL